MESGSRLLMLAVALFTSLFFAAGARAHETPRAAPAQPVASTPQAQGSVLFRNVRIFDGISGRVTGPSDVLVRGERIERIGAGAVPEPSTRVIEGGGRVLMPGLIDAHWHSMMAAPSLGAILNGDH